MTTLLQRCQAVTGKVQQLTLSQRHASQQRLVQERASEWNLRYGKLKSVKARAECLTLPAEARQILAERYVQFCRNATHVLDRLRSNDDIAQLTSDASWTRLLASVDGLAEEFDTRGKLAWKSYIEELGVLEDPTWLRNRAPPTPINDAAIAAYRHNYGAYTSLVRLALPRSADDVTQLPQILASCRREAARITFNLPPDVQQFFQSIQSGSATLASVTPNVLDWLAQNGQLDRYRIQSVGQ